MKTLPFFIALLLFLSTIPTFTISNSHEENNLIEIFPTSVVNETPFLIKISVSLKPDTNYEYAAYVYGGSSVISKIWNGSWKGGYYYTPFKTNEEGNWEKWVHLKVYKEPKEVYNYYIKCKVRNETDTVAEQTITKENGFKIIEEYGWIEGYIGSEINPLENKIVILKNETNAILGISSTENNNVDDFLVQKGCFNVSAPIGNNYTISILERNGTLTENITNITVNENKTTYLSFPSKKQILINEILYNPKSGDEWIELYNNCTYPINITNWVLTDQDGDDDFVFPHLIIPESSYILIYTKDGINETDFSDNITHFYMWKNQGIWTNTGDDVLLKDDSGFAIDYVAYGGNDKADPPLRDEMWDGSWNNHIEKDNPSSQKGYSLARIPNGWDNDSVENWIELEFPTEGIENKESQLILIPDLTITSIEVENIDKIFQGDIIKIKTSIKNNGTKDSESFDVSFYYDEMDNEHLIGTKSYDSLLTNNSHNITLEWDSLNHTGIYLIIINIDSNNDIQESNESNNIATILITIIPKLPSAVEYSVMITEVCYDTYSKYDASEFLRIHNPLPKKINISGWQITDKESDSTAYEGLIVFPEGTIIQAYESIYITKNASSFYEEMCIYPDFEYENSSSGVKKMMVIEKIPNFINHGDEVILKDENSHIIDIVAYGDSNYNGKGWYSNSIKGGLEGEILKRNIDEKTNYYIDSNTSSDWDAPRIYKTGQSNFQYETFEFTGNVKTFVSPDSSYKAIIEELKNAEDSIYLNIYEFTNPYLMDELINASNRNVEVKVFLEGSPVGGISDGEKYITHELWKNEIDVRFIISDDDNNIHARYTFDHAKYVVIDNKTTIIMSENWKLTGIPVNSTYGNRGWGIIIKNNEVSNYFTKVFLADWNPEMKDSYPFEVDNPKYGKPPDNFTMERFIPNGDYEPQFELKEIQGDFKVSPVLCPDTSILVENSIINLLNKAEKSIYVEQLICEIDWNSTKGPMENFYLQAVINAARRGCDVKILLDSRYVNFTNDTDNYDVVQYINNISRKEGLENLKAKLIYLDDLSKLHNKGFIVDGKKTLISSINWGRNSVLKNREVGVIIENPDVASYFTEVFIYDWNLSNKTKNGENKPQGDENKKEDTFPENSWDKENEDTKKEIPKWTIILIFVLLIFVISFIRDFGYKKKK